MGAVYLYTATCLGGGHLGREMSATIPYRHSIAELVNPLMRRTACADSAVDTCPELGSGLPG